MIGRCYSWRNNALVLRVRVQTGASCDSVAGLQGDRLKIRIAATPVDGRANARLLQFLAMLFGVTKRDVEILSGIASRDKRVRIRQPEILPPWLPPAA